MPPAEEARQLRSAEKHKRSAQERARALRRREVRLSKDVERTLLPAVQGPWAGGRGGWRRMDPGAPRRTLSGRPV